MIKLKRRIGSAVLAVMMLLSLMPLTALAANKTTHEVTDTSELTAALTKAQAGDTIELAGGTYNIGTLTLTKTVSIKGAGADSTTLNGKIQYSTNNASASDGESISIEGITLVATDSAKDKGIRWSIRTNSNNNGVIQGYTLNIKDCVISGFEYGTALDTSADNCNLNVSGTTFDTGCAVSVKDGNSVTFLDNVTVKDGFAVQSFNNGYSQNGYYNDYNNYAEDVNNGAFTPDVNIASPTNKVALSAEGLVDLLKNSQNGDTIVLGKSITLSSNGLPGTAISGKTLTIDGQGNTISFEKTNSSTNGVFGNDTNPLYGGTKLTVKNLVIENTGAQAGYASIVGYNANGAEVTYEGCTFKNLYAAVYVNPITQSPENGGVTLSITGCKYDGTSYGYAKDSSGYQLTEVIFTGNTGDFSTGETVKQVVYAEVDVNGQTYTKAFNTIQDAVDAANDNSTITVTPGTYDGNIQFGGKSLTIKAQYPAYVNGQKTDDSKLSKFTGTFNTSEGTTDNSFKEGQTVVIDGFALSGDGLKIGNNNYNTVGNLVVQNCTMETGNNLEKGNVVNHNMYNYFVKVSGNAGAPYASVTVQNNYVSGALADLVTPIQLWDVKDATITGNVIELTDAADHQAINISKMSEQARIEVSGNKITGAGGGIYVTTWQLGGNSTNQAAKFTGTITVKDNTMTNVGSDGMEPIFLGYEKAATDSNPYGILTKDSDLKVEGNQNNGQPVAAVIGQPDGVDPVAYTVTVIDRDQTLYSYTVNDGGEITLPAAPSRAGYSFRGWYGNGHLYAAGDVVTITEDTTFVAQWSDNTPYYTITVKDAENGTVTCYAKSAAKGADVTLNVKADVGYQLDKLTVTDASGNVIDVEKVNNTTYTFVMPGSKVTVEAIFAPTSVEPSDLPFTDVSTSDWFYGAVKFVYENGLMDGVGNNLFAPNATLNRAMAVTILYRLEGSPAVTTDAGFNDVAAGTWYTDAVNWAAANNIVNGVEGNNFDPTGSLTREQMATVLYRYAQYKGADVSASGDLSGFVDSANVSSWAADAVKWAVGSGLVNGVEGNALAPQGTSTRAQAATVLMRFVG